MSQQTTLTRDVVVKGIGLHSGDLSRVILRPAAANTGIVFVQNSREIPVSPTLVQSSPLCTLLNDGNGFTLSTVEHLMAALFGLGIDTVRIEVEGHEVPILDGSALPWVEAIDAAGRQQLETPQHSLIIIEKTEIKDAERHLIADTRPSPWLVLNVNIDFPHPAIGQQTWRGIIDEKTFRTEIAPARTFTLESEIESARRAGLIKGGDLTNAVVFGQNGYVINPDGLRFPNEPVRHKALDVLGDMYMAGRPLFGSLTMTHPGHTANNHLLRQIMGLPSA